MFILLGIIYLTLVFTHVKWYNKTRTIIMVGVNRKQGMRKRAYINALF